MSADRVIREHNEKVEKIIKFKDDEGEDCNFYNEPQYFLSFERVNEIVERMKERAKVIKKGDITTLTRSEHKYNGLLLDAAGLEWWEYLILNKRVHDGNSHLDSLLDYARTFIPKKNKTKKRTRKSVSDDE